VLAPLIIVGTGPVGIRLAKDLLARNYTRPIILFGDEPWQPYNRVQLSSLLAGDTTLDKIANPIERELPVERELSDAGKVTLHLGQRVAAIDAGARTITDATGITHHFATLVLATGSSAHVPNIQGTDKSGVFTLRNIRDTEALIARRVRSRHVVVVGGGLLGIEAARALQRASTRVTIVQQGPHLMNRQLDDAAAQLLLQRVDALGIEALLGAGLAEILGDDRVHGVRLRNGQQIECDTVLLATGIRPNIELARDAWIKVAHGIVVDDTLQTSATDIYAIGECAEHRGRTYGLVAPGFEQSAVLADRLVGGQSLYVGSTEAAQLKVIDQPVFSAGEVIELAPRSRLREWVWRDKGGHHYRKLVTHRGHLIGALAIGDNAENPRLLEAISTRRKLHWWELLRFRDDGRCWSDDAASVLQWPATAVVCQCMGVTRRELGVGIQRGCDSVAALRAATGASSVCGSCAPLLQELLGESGKREAPAGANSLWFMAALAAILLATWWLLPALPVAGSVQSSLRFDRIWNDGFWKQVSGFTVLGLSLLGLIMSLRKRTDFFRLGKYSWWRTLHIAIGVLCVVLLGVHTGFNIGVNLNQWLLIDFMVLLAIGAGASFVLGREHRLAPRLARKLRSTVVWSHVLAAWPLPVLLIFHVLTVYYF